MQNSIEYIGFKENNLLLASGPNPRSKIHNRKLTNRLNRLRTTGRKMVRVSTAQTEKVLMTADVNLRQPHTF